MTTPDTTPEPRPRVVNLTGLLDRLYERFDDGAPPETKVTVAELLETIGRRAYGPLLLFIGLFSISPASFITGMTWISATIIILIAVQMLVGRKTPWLPGSILRISLSRGLLFKGLGGMKPWARRIDWFLKPRFAFLTDWPFVPLVALVCIAAALISYPAGFIPFAPFFPGMVIVFIGLGMTGRDGLMILIGTALVVGSGWFLFKQVGWV